MSVDDPGRRVNEIAIFPGTPPPPDFRITSASHHVVHGFMGVTLQIRGIRSWYLLQTYLKRPRGQRQQWPNSRRIGQLRRVKPVDPIARNDQIGRKIFIIIRIERFFDPSEILLRPTCSLHAAVDSNRLCHGVSLRVDGHLPRKLFQEEFNDIKFVLVVRRVDYHRVGRSRGVTGKAYPFLLVRHSTCNRPRSLTDYVFFEQSRKYVKPPHATKPEQRFAVVPG